MSQFQQYFTFEEANRRLPLVRRIVSEILEKGQALKALSVNVADQDAASGDKLRQDIGALVAELDALGCFYQDPGFELGLVDFPSMRNGEEVFLCWRYGEPDIRWYHPLHAGYAGRQPLFSNMAECSDARPI